MSSTPDRRPRRVPAAIVAAVSFVVAMIAVQAAQASTIHACVKPKSGATRIVGANARCHHGEQKLSWGTTGPKGPAGPSGAAGAPGARGVEGQAGANGSGPVFVATESKPVSLPTGHAATQVLEKVVPPGSYELGARTTLVAGATKAKEVAGVACELTDTPGTTGSGESTIEDAAAWVSPLAEVEPNEFLGDSPLGLEAPFTSTVTSTLIVVCINFQTAAVKAQLTQLHALSVTAVK